MLNYLEEWLSVPCAYKLEENIIDIQVKYIKRQKRKLSYKQYNIYLVLFMCRCVGVEKIIYEEVIV